MFHSAWLLVLLYVSTAKGSPGSDVQNMTSSDAVNISISSNSTQETSPETLAGSDESLAATEGDIVIPEARNAIKMLWEKATVAFTIDKKLAHRETDIKKAFHMISNSTCIQFKPRQNELTYLKLKKAKWCASYVGCRGGPQLLFISDSCKVGNICHEVVHALGMHHEHTRKDRDRYIAINWQNILTGKEKNFRVKDGDTLNLPYDLTSVMHYGPYFFSKGGKPVMRALNARGDMGQRSRLTELDAQKLRTLYKCENRYKPV